MSGSNGLPKYPSTNRENEFMDLKYRGALYRQTDQLLNISGSISGDQWVSPGSILLNATTPNTVTGPSAAVLMAALEKKYLATPGSVVTITLHNSDPTNTKTVTVAGLTPAVTIPPNSYETVSLVVTENDNTARTFAYYVPGVAGGSTISPAPVTTITPGINNGNQQPYTAPPYTPLYPIMVWNGTNWVASNDPIAQTEAQWIQRMQIQDFVVIGLDTQVAAPYHGMSIKCQAGAPYGMVTAGNPLYPIISVKMNTPTNTALDNVRNPNLAMYQAQCNLNPSSGLTYMLNGGLLTARAFNVIVGDNAAFNESFYIAFSGEVRSGQAGHFATAFTVISSRDTKRDIVPVQQSSLDAILSLSPVEFNYKTDPEKTPRRIGLIAEDVAEKAEKSALHLLEGLVNRKEDKTPEGINTSQLLALAIHAIQELAGKLKNLEEELSKKV